MTKSLRASLIALSIAAMPFAAQAAGLGQINVYSGLGQPLRAEIQVSATAEELQTLNARIASADAFRQANLTYGSAVSAIRVSVDTRGGRPVLRLTSDRPVNDPFVDLLVELDWGAGRLVREYTFLLDPVDIAAPRPLAASVDTPAAAPVPRPQAAPAPAQRAAAVRAPSGTYTVRRGDTMHRIATAHAQPGSTLDQMLVALLRANPQAFDDGNINRLRSGAVLTLPGADAVRAIDAAEARREIRAQSADFEAYRRGLARSAAQQAPVTARTEQESVGRITPRVEEAARVEQAGDQVRVSRTQTGGGDSDAQARLSALEEELGSRERALEEANQRLAQLEKSIRDLQQLLELQSGTMGQLQQQAEAAPAAESATAPGAVTETLPATVQDEAEAKGETAPVSDEEGAAPAEPVAQEAAPAPAPAPAAAPAAVSNQPDQAPVSAPAAAERPAPAVAPAAPAPQPSLVDSLMADPAVLAGGGGVLALLLALLGLKLRQRRKEAEIQAASSALDADALGGNSQAVFGSGGQSVDTGATSIMHTDFSQSGLSAIDADEGVDPVAEADVYMAYGRDAQAEEILLDALKADPARTAIHLKLLEIYAQRRSARQFETVATELYAQSAGNGRDWEKAAAMGRKLDPDNPLYAAAAAPAAASAPAPATALDDAPTQQGGARAPVDQGVALAAAGAALATAAVKAEEVPSAAAGDQQEQAAQELSALDFTISSPVEPSQSQLRDTWTVPGDLSRLTNAEGELPDTLPPQASVEEDQAALQIDDEVIDFELDLDEVQDVASLDLAVSGEPAAEAAAVEARQEEDGGLVFDLDIGDFEVPAAAAEPPAGAAEALEVEEAPELGDLPEPTASDATATQFESTDGLVSGLEFELPDMESEPPASGLLDLNATVVASSLPASGDGDEAFPADAEGVSSVEGREVQGDERIVDLEKTSFDSSLLEFDFDIDTPSATDIPATMGPAGLDLTSIDLDLENFDDQGVPEMTAVPFEAESTDIGQPRPQAVDDEPLPEVVEAAADEADNEEAETKLELARAYEEMGDNEGALELLQEVLGEGSSRQQRTAQEMIARLG